MNGEDQASCERNKLLSENLEFRPFSIQNYYNAFLH